MIEFFSAGFLGLWLKAAGFTKILPNPSRTMSRLVLQPIDVKRDQLIDSYLSSLAQQGILASNQGLWLQTDRELLIDHRGQQPQTPASLTKAATTLAALKTWGPAHRFQTLVWAQGPIRNGVLEGDLLIQGGGDPLFVTSEAIALGHQIKGLGIRKVTGRLKVAGPFTFNLDSNLQTAAEALKAVWNAPSEAEAARQGMPKGTPQPSLVIEGAVVVQSGSTPPMGPPLVSHASLPVVDLLKFMNVYSSNRIAEGLSNLVGGPQAIQTIALETQRIAPSEILLNNGSGLGQTNQISPRAVVGLFQAVQAQLQMHQLTLADVFAVMGRDGGTLEKRHLPIQSVVKTGTLWNVSGLAGVIQTQRYGPVWFALMNRGENFTEEFRSRQDQFLQSLVQLWGGQPRVVGMPLPKEPHPSSEEIQRRQLIHRFMQDDFLSH